jgi:hypothetical protein
MTQSGLCAQDWSWSLKTHAPLQTRVGIAMGLVVVGDLIGSGASQEQAIVGETPNLAARLQGIAEPNSVVIAEKAITACLYVISGFGSLPMFVLLFDTLERMARIGILEPTFGPPSPDAPAEG